MHLFIYILTSWEQVLYWSLHSCRSDRSSQKLCLTDTRASPETHRKSRILNILLSFFILMNNPYPSWSNGSYKRVIIFSYTLLMLMLLLLYCLTYKMGIVMEFSIKECCLFLARYFLMTNNRTQKYITLTVLYAFKICSKYVKKIVRQFTSSGEFRRPVHFLHLQNERITYIYIYIYICISIYNHLKFHVFTCNINILIEELFF